MCGKIHIPVKIKVYLEMIEKETEVFKKILGNAHPEDFRDFYEENKDSMSEVATAFHSYLKDILKKNGLTQQDAFLNADVPERYGHKLLTCENHTKQRDVILRICFGAGMSLEET